MWIVVFIVVLLIIVILEWTNSIFSIFADSFNSNIYGLVSLVFAVVGVFFFWASSKTFQDYKIKEKIMSIFKPENVINMSESTLSQLSEQLTNSLTSPTPLVFKGWANQRLKLDVERVKILLDYINTMISTGDAYIKYKASACISFEKIQRLANTELNNLKTSEILSEIALIKAQKDYVYEVENQKLDLESKKLDINSKRKSIEYAYDNHKLEVKDKELDLMIKKNMALLEKDKKTAETKILILKANDDSRLKKQVSELFDKILAELKVDNITPSQVLLLVNMLGNNPINSVDDYETKKKMVDAEIEKMRQEAEIKKQEVRTKSYEADHKLFKMEIEKTNLA